MRFAWWVLFVVACKGKSAPATGNTSASGSTASGRAPAVAVDTTTPSGLVFEATESPELDLAFDKKVPRLPALSADGTRIADIWSHASMPSFPNPIFVGIWGVNATEADRAKVERLELVDEKMAYDGNGESQMERWDPKPEVAKLVRERGIAAMKRLAGFSSLDHVELKIDSGGFPQTTQIGDVTLANKIDGNQALTLTLSGAKTQRQKIAVYNDGQKPEMLAGGSCEYSPNLHDAYTDRAKTKLFLKIVFHFNEACSPQEPMWIAWDLPTASDAELAKVVVDQFDNKPELTTDDAIFINRTTLEQTDTPPYIIKGGQDQYMGHGDDVVAVAVSRDGKSAWGSATTKLAILEQNKPGRDDPWRASSVLVKTAKGWRIAVSMWSAPWENAAANKAASNGKLETPAFTGDAGDATLDAAFGKLVSDGLDPDAAARADLVAIGSGPGERTVGGGTFAAGWNAGWKAKAKITSSTARVLPGGTTGWVGAVVELPKKGYKIPFIIFAVFDKTAAGQWSLVHIHFTI